MAGETRGRRTGKPAPQSRDAACQGSLCGGFSAIVRRRAVWDTIAPQRGIGDPAVDIEEVLTSLSTDSAAALTDAATLECASMHRATFPLQRAVAGYLHDDARLSRTGLRNLELRLDAEPLRSRWPSARP